MATIQKERKIGDEGARAIIEIVDTVAKAAAVARAEAMAVPVWRVFKRARAESRLFALSDVHEIVVAKALELLNSSHGMPDSRLRELDRDGEGSLSEEEIANGWHWCPEFDDLLMNKNDGECMCGLQDFHLWA
jgi:hypothetical protein